MFLVAGTGLEGPSWVHREHQGSWEGQAAGVPECHLRVTVVRGRRQLWLWYRAQQRPQPSTG